MADPIPASDLPLATPGASDTVVGVDESTGAARRFLATELGAAAVAASNAVVGTAAKKYKAIGCVIRQDTAGSGWYFIDDANHTPIGVASISEASGDITINYNFTSSSVGTLNITPDETYAGVGLVAGASVGSTSAIISLYAPLQARISNQAIVWGNYLGGGSGDITADFTSATSGGFVTITHPAITHVDATGSVAVVENYDTTSGAQYLITPTKSAIKIWSMAEIAGSVSASGGVITVTHGLITAPTCTWDAANNRLTITHATSPSNFGYSLTPASGGYIPVLKTISGTVMTVELYDYAGVKFTGAAPPDVTFSFRRAGHAPCPWPATTKIIVRRPLVKLRAQDVFGANGNFWIQGVMEVA